MCQRKLLILKRSQMKDSLVAQILQMEEPAWPGSLSQKVWPDHPWHLVSFCMMEGDTLLGHSAVVGKTICHQGRTYCAMAISEMIVDFTRQGQGVGKKLLAESALWMKNHGADLSLFTCQPTLVPFYQKGGWLPADRLCLVGGTKERPFRSDDLGLSSMIRFFSERALARQSDFSDTDVCLYLGENQLW